MLVGGELTHVSAALQDHGLRQRDPHAIHQAEVHPADAFQVAADFLTLVKLILAVRITLAGGQYLIVIWVLGLITVAARSQWPAPRQLRILSGNCPFL